MWELQPAGGHPGQPGVFDSVSGQTESPTLSQKLFILWLYLSITSVHLLSVFSAFPASE